MKFKKHYQICPRIRLNASEQNNLKITIFSIFSTDETYESRNYTSKNIYFNNDEKEIGKSEFSKMMKKPDIQLIFFCFTYSL